VVGIFLTIISLAYYNKFWQRAILLFIGGCIVFVFFKANSRGASFALGAGMPCLWLMQKRKGKSGVIAVLLLIVAVAFAPQSYWDRLGTVSHYQDDSSAMQRLELWSIAFKLIDAHPVLGVGFSNFMMYAPNSPHDAYLQIASEVGIPAMFVYVAMLINGLWAAYQTVKLTSPDDPRTRYLHYGAQGIFCCILTVVVQGFTTGLAHRETVYITVALALATIQIRKSLLPENAEAAPAEEESALEPAYLSPA
jgi:putative inorganic carbon (HCO3(-)) transporter